MIEHSGRPSRILQSRMLMGNPTGTRMDSIASGKKRNRKSTRKGETEKNFFDVKSKKSGPQVNLVRNLPK